MIQRVTRAEVAIDQKVVGQIRSGVLALIGIRPTDTPASGLKLLDRLLQYRIFDDAAGKMNLNLSQAAGALLLVPQFTLAADTSRGLRPGFSTAAAPQLARGLFENLVAAARTRHPEVANGEFGADMQVSLTNDGPVTFWLES